MRISWNEVAKIVKRGEKSVQTNKSEKQHKVNVTVTKLWDWQAGKTWVISPFAVVNRSETIQEYGKQTWGELL